VVTKRALGAALILFGIGLAVVVLAVDLVGTGHWGGFGPVQVVGLGGGLFLTLAGGILLRTNGRPA
jgi:hypothetical protein